MRRIAKVLVATALMLVLMATTVSPAFAVSENAWDCSSDRPCGHKHEDPEKGKEARHPGIGWGAP